ncbi:hypothetical protein AB0G31_26180, partial [Streptomyces fradiae]
MPRLLWWGGLTALAVGAVLCVLGWYGASGEHVAERQLPYLASGTVPGAALVVAGAVSWPLHWGGVTTSLPVVFLSVPLTVRNPPSSR